jgi:sugar transferase EpsL
VSPIAKRVLDLIFASVAAVLLSPLMALIAAAIFVSTGVPIILRQERAGMGGERFVLLKFRTMSEQTRGNEGALVSDEARITPLGGFLRRWSLDELPQIWNILIGKMSVVGPRPLLMRYLARYTNAQARRHEVKPGLTGLAQVSGRNSLSWEQKFELDVWYVDHQSLWLDARILVLTALNVFRREGVNQPGHATVEEFLGNRNAQSAEQR